MFEIALHCLFGVGKILNDDPFLSIFSITHDSLKKARESKRTKMTGVQFFPWSKEIELMKLLGCMSACVGSIFVC